MERKALIFITVGSQKFQFNRLLMAVDKLVASGEVKDTVVAQIGYSDYEPKHYEYKQFLNRDEFAEMEGRADIIITHGGTGAIIGAVKKGKKVVAVPRLAKYGEHVDDHQLQLIAQFTGSNLISSCENLDELGQVLDEVKMKKFDHYQSNTDKYLKSIT
ncbi:MAG: beta(1,3)galactosyltransferase EpsH, partial [Lachnospiraceae bacterium]|nr:beta(1,3)galactosyltransferase EpsH [Lachnospiraceae bacterium]